MKFVVVELDLENMRVAYYNKLNYIGWFYWITHSIGLNLDAIEGRKVAIWRA